MRRLALLMAVPAAILATGCTSTTNGTEDELRQAVLANVEAVNTADTEGMRTYVSSRCRAKQTDSERTDTAKLVNEMFGKIDIKNITISDMNDDAARARVRATTGIDSIDKEATGAWWVLEEGTWRNDTC